METTPPTHRLRVDGRLKRIKNYAFSNENAYVWMGPDNKLAEPRWNNGFASTCNCSQTLEIACSEHTFWTRGKISTFYLEWVAKRSSQLIFTCTLPNVKPFKISKKGRKFKKPDVNEANVTVYYRFIKFSSCKDLFRINAVNPFACLIQLNIQQIWIIIHLCINNQI